MKPPDDELEDRAPAAGPGDLLRLHAVLRLLSRLAYAAVNVAGAALPYRRTLYDALTLYGFLPSNLRWC
ncbi:MAG: hypothetical protein NUW21_04195 [Elusimicrobia bacterium]|nr:hypothetical protein [Elusimicrobiota bacterium]